MMLKRTALAFCRLSKDKTGNFAVLTALLATPLFYAASLSINTAGAYRISERMQSALDTATMAALTEYERSHDSSIAKTEAINLFEANFWNETSQNLGQSIVNNHLHLSLQDSEGKYTAASTFVLDYAPTFLPGPSFQISRSSQVAVATGSEDGETCVLSLSSTASRAIDVSGNTTINMSECTMATNSTADDAIYAGGNASLSAECLQAAGGIDSGTSQVTLRCGNGKEHAMPVVDPYSDLAMPTPAKYPNPAVKATGNSTLQLEPGTYKGMDLKGAVDLAPGQYIIDGGSLTVNAKANLNGSRVTIFLMNGASIKVDGGATVNLTPANGGTWAGFSIVAGRDNTSAATITGNSDAQLSGIIYMPASQLTYSGSGSPGSGDCVRLLAQTVKFTGNSKFESSCSSQLADHKVTTFTMPYFVR